MKSITRLLAILLLPLLLLFAAGVAHADTTHVVQPGDTLWEIAMQYGVSMDAIVEANNLENPRVIRLGSTLTIPGVDGPLMALPMPAPGGTAPAAPDSGEVPVNLFKNGSFEGDWYYHIYNELQIPVGWQVAIDEGPNTLQPGDGGNFARPEIRVIPRASLPEGERDMFVFDGYKTMKAFKGYAPTIFHFFQDVPLQPGRYRMTLNFFPDIVTSYTGGRQFHTDPLAGEIRIIHNEDNLGWTSVKPGEKNWRIYEFTVSQAGTVRLGASFRNRFAAANNGWFLDDWRLERIGK